RAGEPGPRRVGRGCAPSAILLLASSPYGMMRPPNEQPRLAAAATARPPAQARWCGGLRMQARHPWSGALALVCGLALLAACAPAAPAPSAPAAAAQSPAAAAAPPVAAAAPAVPDKVRVGYASISITALPAWVAQD